MLVSLLALVLACVGAAGAAAQAPAVDFTGDWTWEGVRAAPGVNGREADWLAANLPDDEARMLFRLVGELSSPEAAQLLPSFMYVDGTRQFGAFFGASYLDSLVQRPPPGTAGAVRVAYLTARARHTDLTTRLTRGVYSGVFTGRALALPPLPAAGAPEDVSVRLSFDFAPAETLLAVVTTPDVGVRAAAARVSTRPFDLLIQHHSQPFYTIPLTREQLALSLAGAASTEGLARLYRYANPRGFYHFGDVAENRDRYRAIIDTLRTHEGAIARYVAAAMAPYLPPGTHLDRDVSFFFGDGADGWAVSGQITAVVLEYYKDDYGRLIEVMLHEAFHAAQGAVRANAPPPTVRTGADAELARVLQQLLVEGTANFLAPSQHRTPEAMAEHARAAAALLDEAIAVAAAGGDRAAMQDVINRGVAGGGPLYTLGGEMSRVIVEAFGPQELGACLRRDGAAFVRTYLRALERQPDAPRYLSAAFAEAVARMPE